MMEIIFTQNFESLSGHGFLASGVSMKKTTENPRPRLLHVT